MSDTATSSNCKGENEHHNLSTSIHSGGDKVVVLDEELWVVLAEVELRKVGDQEESGKGAVDSDEEVAHEPENDRRVEISPGLLSGNLVHDVGGKWDEEADQEGKGDPFVLGSNAEHDGSNTPRNGQRVELLNVLTRPNVRSENTCKNRCLVLDDGDLVGESVKVIRVLSVNNHSPS